MCNFFSVLILKNGDLRWHPLIDSHTKIARLFQLPDNGRDEYAKAELTPPTIVFSDDWLDPSKWNWRIDEPTRPAWLDEVEARAEKSARAVVKTFIRDEGARVDLVIGQIIIGKAVTITEAMNCRAWLSGSSEVTACGSSEVTACDSSKVTACDSSKVTARDSSKVTACDSSKVTARDSSKVTACDSSEVTACDSSKVTACACGCHTGKIVDDRKSKK